MGFIYSLFLQKNFSYSVILVDLRNCVVWTQSRIVIKLFFFFRAVKFDLSKLMCYKITKQ